MTPSSGFGGGAGLGLGMLIMPIMIASMILRRPASPVRKLIDAGAVSPETARKPRALGIPRELVLQPLLRKGVACKLDDGRWYIDRERERRVRFRTMVVSCILAGLLGLGLWGAFMLLGTSNLD